MIIGNGLVANAFDKYRMHKKILIFASGVSNSLEQNLNAFKREETLLKESLAVSKDSMFVYFGTCSVYDSSVNATAYVQHKLNMEEIIKCSGQSFNIFRVPQIVGHCSNQSTVLNYFYNHIVTGASFDLWQYAYRYLVDIADVVRYVSYVLSSTKSTCQVHNLATSPYKVPAIVDCLEKLLGIRAKYRLVPKGKFYLIPNLKGQVSLADSGLNVDELYMEKILEKFVELARKEP